MRRVRQLECDLTDHRNGRPTRPVSVAYPSAAAEETMPSLGALAKKVGAAMAQLLTAASQVSCCTLLGQYLGTSIAITGSLEIVIYTVIL